jgi:O-antigen/teichoic acid export membrane protein
MIIPLLKRISRGVLAKGIASAVGFLATIYLANNYDKLSLGIYFFIISIVALICSFFKLGLDVTLLKNISMLYENKKWDDIRDDIFQSLYICVLFFGVFALFFYFVVYCISTSGMIAWDHFYSYPIIVGCSVLFIATSLITSALKGMNEIFYALFIQTGLTPLLVVLFSYLSKESIGLVYCFFLGNIFAFISSIIALRLKIKFKKIRINFTKIKYLVKPSKSLVSISFLNIFIEMSPSLILVFYGLISDVASFNILQKISMVSALILVGINSVIAQKFSIYYKENRKQELKEMFKNSLFICSTLASIYFMFIYFFDFKILSLFGDNYVDYGAELMIISLGYAVSLAAGPTGQLILMSGNSPKYQYVILITAFAGLTSGLIFIPQYGVFGAVCSLSIAMIVKNVLGLSLSYRIINDSSL